MNTEQNIIEREVVGLAASSKRGVSLSSYSSFAETDVDELQENGKIQFVNQSERLISINNQKLSLQKSAIWRQRKT